MVNNSDLSSWCQSRNGQVIVCAEEGDTWIPFDRSFDSKVSPGSHKPYTTYGEIYCEIVSHQTEGPKW